MSDAQKLLENLQISGVKVSVIGSDLKIIPPGKRRFSPEIVIELKAHKQEIINLISSAENIEPDPLRDFCGVCGSRLFEQNFQWHCPTEGCFERRVQGFL